MQWWWAEFKEAMTEDPFLKWTLYGIAGLLIFYIIAFTAIEYFDPIV